MRPRSPPLRRRRARGGARAARARRGRRGAAPHASPSVGVAGARPRAPRALGARRRRRRRCALTVVLAPRDPAGLAALADRRLDPGSPCYHHYLTTPQFAARFGAAPATRRRRSRAALARTGCARGRSPPTASRSRVSTDAGDASRAFGVGLRRYRERDGAQRLRERRRAARARRRCAAPSPACSASTTFPPRRRRASSAPAARRPPRRARSAPTGRPGRRRARRRAPRPAQRRPHDRPDRARLRRSTASTATGDLGAGRDRSRSTSSSPSRPAQRHRRTFESCYGPRTPDHHRHRRRRTGRRRPAATRASRRRSTSTTSSGSRPPSADRRSTRAPTAAPGHHDTLAAIVSDPAAPRSISDSWGLCEPTGRPGRPTRSATRTRSCSRRRRQGQSVLVAVRRPRLGRLQGRQPTLAVDDPASQPFATGVGGTR